MNNELNYSLKKSTMERFDIRLKGENSWRCNWAVISISDDGMFNAQTDCGDFAYRWGSFGDSFKEFLVDICSKDTGYLYNKISSLERAGKIDVNRTINSMKEKVIQNRQENRNRTPYVFDELSPEEARYLWDELDSIQNSHSEVTHDAFASIFYHELPSEEREKVFGDEFWHDDYLVETSDKQAETFCDVVAPVFAEILKEELLKNKI